MSEPTKVLIRELDEHLSGAAPGHVTVEQLREHVLEFQKYLDIDAIVPTLRKAGLLNDSEVWELTHCDRCPRDRIWQLLTYIMSRKGSKGPDKLIECIQLIADRYPNHRRLVRLFSRKEQEINSSCLDTLKRRRKTEVFADFVASVFEEMDGNINHEHFKVFVTASATLAENPECSLSQDDKETIGKAQSLSHCFTVLNWKYWNHQNIYLLERILRRYVSDAELLLSEYHKKIEDIDEIDEEEAIPRHMHLVTTSKSLNESACSEWFPSMMKHIFKCIQVSPDALRVFLSVVLGTSSLEDLLNAKTLEAVFTVLNCSISWDNYTVLSQTVERFGDEKLKELVRDYNRDFLSLESQKQSEHRGCWHFHNAKLFLSEQKRKQIAKKVDTFRGEFAAIVSESFDTFDPRSAMNMVAGVSASVQYPSPIKPFSNFTNGASLSDVFLHFHHFGWNYRQYHLLQSLIEKCGTPELQSSLESYTERLSALEKDMTLAELLWVLPQGSLPSRPGFVHMTLTFDTDFDYTVQQLSEFQTSHSPIPFNCILTLSYCTLSKPFSQV